MSIGVGGLVAAAPTAASAATIASVRPHALVAIIAKGAAGRTHFSFTCPAGDVAFLSGTMFKVQHGVVQQWQVASPQPTPVCTGAPQAAVIYLFPVGSAPLTPGTAVLAAQLFDFNPTTLTGASAQTVRTVTVASTTP